MIFAYIDPFTGTLVLQLLAMAFMSVLIFFKKVKAVVLGTFGFGVVVGPKTETDIPSIKLDEAVEEEKKAA